MPKQSRRSKRVGSSPITPQPTATSRTRVGSGPVTPQPTAASRTRAGSNPITPQPTATSRTRVGSSPITPQPTATSRTQRTPRNSPLTQDDIPALVREVVQTISRGGHPTRDVPAAVNYVTPAHPIESNEQIQRPLASTRATSGGAITESAALTQEDIPSLVQQVLQALPGATTHNNNAGDHHPPQQSISGSSTSIEQSSQPPPSEL